ncbi:hypothetical protein OYC64_010711 [Pagothenia borchgrevinki]|uniref:Uncharacterized protein n=1 Tax=Pagothenia borchgrevinki TaxID=8213 RepID=A0ABD2GXA4_PAGBO
MQRNAFSGLELGLITNRNSTAGLQSVGSTAPNPGYRVLQQKTTTWKVFFRGVTRSFNTGREENKGEGRSDGLWDEIALITNPISPSFPVGRTVLFLPGDYQRTEVFRNPHPQASVRGLDQLSGT